MPNGVWKPPLIGRPPVALLTLDPIDRLVNPSYGLVRRCLAHPGRVCDDSASGVSSITLQIGRELFDAVFLAGLVVVQFASGLAPRVSASPWCTSLIYFGRLPTPAAPTMPVESSSMSLEEYPLRTR